MPPLRPSCSLKRAATNWCLDRDRHDDRGLYCVPCARRHHDFCVSKSRYLWRKRHKRSKTSPPNLYGPPWDDFWERIIPRPGLFHRVSCLYPCNRCECCRFCGGSSFNQRCNEKFVSEQTRTLPSILGLLKPLLFPRLPPPPMVGPPQGVTNPAQTIRVTADPIQSQSGRRSPLPAVCRSACLQMSVGPNDRIYEGEEVLIVHQCAVWTGSGRGAQDADNIWCPVEYNGKRGWANAWLLIGGDGHRIACLMYPTANKCP